MDSRQLNAFIAVFEERNITAAAQRLHLSQPALSGTIKALEGVLGTQLFERQARGVSVTDAARILYPQARRLVAQTESMARQFCQDARLAQLRIGVEGEIAGAHVRAFVAQARQAVPNLMLLLLEGCVGDARLATEDERCEDELFVPLWDDPYAIAMPLDAGTAAPAWIVCPDHPSHQRLLPYYGAAANAPAGQAGSLRLALELVAAGVGACVAPHSLIAQQADVAIHDLDGLALSRRIGLCYAAQALDKPALALLTEHLREAGQG